MQTITVTPNDIVTGAPVHTECVHCHSTITVEAPSLSSLLQAEDAASRFRLPLTRIESRIFNCFYASLGQFLDYQHLILGACGPAYLGSDYPHALRVYIARMRPKLAAAGSQFTIETRPGRGYRLIAGHQLSFIGGSIAGPSPAPVAA